ncbi:oligomeric Golgi complex subunit 8, partial [Radiomyces spectabilis]|uniref:oligomeric Golgi complex subunit 8 n=1 Tax=Radiomyces spectabilis TaxID=64574 RepID=UPI002220B01F
MSLSVSAGSLDDNDDLLHLLTQSWDEESKNAVQTSQWTRDYLHRLTSLPLNELLNEPKELRHEQDKMQREAKQLAFRDYPCFIYAQSCRHQVDETLKGLDHQLTDFATTIPALQDACDTFLQEAGAVMGERSKITRVLEHQNVLVELLEIPQLMETCVLNGYYSEAMDLASHVRLLHLRYPLPVIDTIQDQVKSYSDLMLMQLLSHLRRPIKLAAAMNIIGYLRRLDTFQTENELRMVFLRCRHSFLEQRVDRIKREMSDDTRKRSQDAVDYLKKYIDIMREQMFEIATQYLSVFSNEEQDSLLSDYMVHLTLDIRTTLSEYLGMVQDVSSLASLLTQLQYCGMSLGRIGLDFRHFF